MLMYFFLVHYFGSFGAILLAIIIVLACLKTSIGLITSCSEFFNEVFPKVSYKAFVVVLCIVSFTIANFGLTNIITFAIPVLMFLYPLAIVLILLALAGPLFHYKRSIFAASILFTFFISFIDGYNALIASVSGFEVAVLSNIAAFYEKYLPFYSIGLGWIVPAIIGVIIGLIIPSKK